jgi:hypothetical protein
MFNPQRWWNELNVFWKAVTGGIAGITTIRAGWKPVSDSYNWIVDRYDKPVFNVLEGRKRIEWMTPNPAPIVMTPVSATFIAKATKRKANSVLKEPSKIGTERKGTSRSLWMVVWPTKN